LKKLDSRFHGNDGKRLFGLFTKSSKFFLPVFVPCRGLISLTGNRICIIKWIRVDGFVKSPSAALRFNFVVAAYP
jgi:hypothetical protein